MTLTDAGPLIALVDERDAGHARCVAALDEIQLPMRTTWAAFSEAMYLARKRAGHQAQDSLWALVAGENLRVLDLSATAIGRCAELMAKYRDRPMDLADATVVAMAEERGENLIFTLDSGFEVYRLPGRRKFRIVPA